MAVQVMAPAEGEPPGPGERLGRREADQEGDDQARPRDLDGRRHGLEGPRSRVEVGDMPHPLSGVGADDSLGRREAVGTCSQGPLGHAELSLHLVHWLDFAVPPAVQIPPPASI